VCTEASPIVNLAKPLEMPTSYVTTI